MSLLKHILRQYEAIKTVSEKMHRMLTTIHYFFYHVHKDSSMNITDKTGISENPIIPHS